MSAAAPTVPTPDEISVVVELASLAPSVHNSQPWRFRWTGAALELAEDSSRALPVLDPSGRERVLSCGAALLHAELGFAELGWAVRTTVLPDGGELLARLDVTGRRAPTAQESALVAAVPRRATDRDPYAPEPVAPSVVDRLRVAAEAEGAWLCRVDPHEGEVVLDVLLSHADGVQRRDPAYLAELSSWRTAGGPVGVPDRALPRVAGAARGSSLALRDFDGVGPHGATSGEPPVAEHPTVVVIGTDGDARRDWLIAGRATARVLLTATTADLAAQPLTAVLEVPATRFRLRAQLGVVSHPQIVLRIGHGSRGPASGRLPVAQVLDLAGD